MTRLIPNAALRKRRMPQPPDPPFEAPLATFVRDCMAGVMPEVAVALRYHELLLNYVQGPDPLFVVRQVTGQERGKEVRTRDGTRLLPSDNAPAWWMHAVMFNGVEIASADFSEFVAQIPPHMHRVPGVPTLSRPDTRRLAGEQGWHAAHILDAKDGKTDWASWTRAEATRRFLRNVHPFNVFYVPKVGWQRTGGDPDVIGFVAHIYSRRFGVAWTEFLDAAEGHDVALRREAGRFMFRVSGQPAAAAPTSAPGRPAPTGGSSAWDYLFGARRPPPIGELLASHPRSTEMTAALVEDMDLEGFIVLADVLFNKCRMSDLRRAAPASPARQADLAWRALHQGMSKTHDRPSGWTGAAKLLRAGAQDGMARVRGSETAWLAAAALRVVSGPYREANARGVM